jgi:hypothetical protein
LRGKGESEVSPGRVSGIGRGFALGPNVGERNFRKSSSKKSLGQKGRRFPIFFSPVFFILTTGIVRVAFPCIRISEFQGSRGDAYYCPCHRAILFPKLVSSPFKYLRYQEGCLAEGEDDFFNKNQDIPQIDAMMTGLAPAHPGEAHE